MKQAFKTIGLIGRPGSELAAQTVAHLYQFLKSSGFESVLDSDTASSVVNLEAKYVDKQSLGAVVDLVIVVGGDGSLLGAARAVCDHGTPLLGINRGRLGFLTDISPVEIEQEVSAVLSGEYECESRFLLEMDVVRDGEVISRGTALNDVVLHPGKFIRMIQFELYVDDTFVYSQRSDGIIISTPTGSTAYALSGGGPLMHPKLDAIELVPINPHTLSSRPMIIPGQSSLRLIVGSENTAFPHITCDGQAHVVTQPGDEVRVSKKANQLTLVHPANHDFYETCRRKLGWGSHIPTDSFASDDE